MDQCGIFMKPLRAESTLRPKRSVPGCGRHLFSFEEGLSLATRLLAHDKIGAMTDITNSSASEALSELPTSGLSSWNICVDNAVSFKPTTSFVSLTERITL